jgi:hypothetical protein
MTYDDTYDGPQTPPDEAPKAELAVVIDVPESNQSRRLLPERLYADNCRPIKLEEITLEMLQNFLNELEKTGLYETAANRVGLHGRVVERLMKLDDRFKIMCEDRIKSFVDTLQMELHRRAVLGWDEPQFNHKTGVQIGVVRRYDSRLLELMIKRHVPEYNEKVDVSVTQQVGVLVVPIRATSVREWEKMVGNVETVDDRPKQIESKLVGE